MTMRYSAQIRAARAILGWSQDQLAQRAGIGLATLRRIEQGEGLVKGNFSTILKIQKAFEQAGISFTEDNAGEIGVRLKKKADDSRRVGAVCCAPDADVSRPVGRGANRRAFIGGSDARIIICLLYTSPSPRDS